MATLASLIVNLQANTGQYQRGMRGASRNADSVRKSVGRLGAALVGVFGARQLFRGLRSITQAFIRQEDAVQGLRASLIVTGKDGVASLDALTRSAAELQKVTRAGDEAIIAATASMALLAPALDTAALKDAQSAIIGIAETFTKGDLEAAALLIGKSVGSTTNALTRYGIVIDTTATQQEKLAQIVDQSNTFFEVAKARALTTGGAMAQLVNAFGDVKEAIGQMLATRTGFAQFLRRVTTTLADIATILSGSAPQIGRMFQLLGIIAGNAFSVALLTGLVGIPRLIRDFLKDLPLVIKILPPVAAMRVQAEALTDLTRTFLSGIRDEAKASIEGSVIELAEMADKIRGLAPVIAAGTDEGIIVPIVKKLSTLEQSGLSAGRSLIRGLISGIGDQSLGEFLKRVINRLAEDFIIGGLEDLLGISSPSSEYARIGRMTVAGYIQGLQQGRSGLTTAIGETFALPRGPSPAFAGGGGIGSGAVVVHQEINFNFAALDAPSVAQLLRSQKGTIVKIVGEAVQDGVRFRGR